MPWARLKLCVELYSTDAEEWWNTCPPRTLRPPSGPSAAAKAKIIPQPEHVPGENNDSQKNASSSTLTKPRAKKVSVADIANNVKEMKLIEAGYEEVKKPDLSHVVATTRFEGVDGARIFRNRGDLPPYPEGIGPILVEDGRRTCYFTAERFH